MINTSREKVPILIYNSFQSVILEAAYLCPKGIILVMGQIIFIKELIIFSLNHFVDMLVRYLNWSIDFHMSAQRSCMLYTIYGTWWALLGNWNILGNIMCHILYGILGEPPIMRVPFYTTEERYILLPPFQIINRFGFLDI